VIGTDPRVTASSTRATDTEWTLRTFLELGALPTAVPCARLHTKHVLWEWQLSTLADTIELIVSELVTNAVQASTGLTGSRRSGRWVPGVPPVRLWLFSDRHRVLIQVWDGNDKLPAPQHAEPDAESGRGLLLVESLSAEWGFYPPERSSGKVVWAMLEEPPP
jgi:anti-sigma regulatory factor (Ser/Thr protein kinase)